MNIKAFLIKQWAFFIGLIVVLFFMLNVTGIDLSYYPGDLGDARFNNYILEHSHRFITGQTESLWEAPFMYPEKDIVSYSDNLIGSVPFYSIFRISGFDRESAFQLWFILMSLLSFTTCYLFLNWYFKNKYAAVIGALVFAISIALQSQMTHAQMFPRFPIPIAFWMVFLFMKDLKPIYFFLAILTIVYQFYCGVYLGFMLLIPIAIMVVFCIVFQRKLIIEKLKSTKWIMKMVLSLFMNAILLYPLMMPYFIRSTMVPKKPYSEALTSIPTLKSFVFSQEGSFMWTFLDSIAKDYKYYYDHQIFVGGIALISCLIFIWNSIKKRIRDRSQVKDSTIVFLIVMLLTFLLFLKFFDFSFYMGIFVLPGFNSLRSLARIINVELLFFAFATAYVVLLVLKKYRKHSVILFLTIVSLLIVDNSFKSSKIYRTEKKMAQERVNDLISRMKHIPKGSVVSFEPKELLDAPYAYQLDAMLASQTLELICINAYSATSPPAYNDYWYNLNEESRNAWLESFPENIDSLYVIK